MKPRTIMEMMLLLSPKKALAHSGLRDLEFPRGLCQVVVKMVMTMTVVLPLEKVLGNLGDLAQKAVDHRGQVQRGLSRVVKMTIAKMVRLSIK